MIPSICPYLTFSGQCREAMTYYQQCFGGDLQLQTVAESPVASQCPPDISHHIMHSMLTNGNLTIMASDMHREAIVNGNTITLVLQGLDESDARRLFGQLSDRGQVIEPLHESFWGALFGVAEDRFGMRWLFNVERQNNN